MASRNGIHRPDPPGIRISRPFREISMLLSIIRAGLSDFGWQAICGFILGSISLVASEYAD
jgi:hypothetical protein